MAAGHKAPLCVFVTLAAACTFILVSDLRGSAEIGGSSSDEQPVAATATATDDASSRLDPPSIQPPDATAPRTTHELVAGVRVRVVPGLSGIPFAVVEGSTPTVAATPAIGVATRARLGRSGTVVQLLPGAGASGIDTAPSPGPTDAATGGGSKPAPVPTLDFADLWSLPTPSAETPATAPPVTPSPEAPDDASDAGDVGGAAETPPTQPPAAAPEDAGDAP